MTAPWTLGGALGAFLARPQCAPTTLYNHRKHAAALLRALGDRPVADFAGKKGGRLIASLLQGDLASGPSYSALRQRLRTLRLALDLAIVRHRLAELPDPWPVPPPGSHGHLDRGRYVLAADAAKLDARPRRRIVKPTQRAPGASSVAPEGALTLAAGLDRLLRFGLLKRSPAAVAMHRDIAGQLTAFFGAKRAVKDFEGAAGYKLLWHYVEAEGPSGRGLKYTTLKKRINTLRLVLKEARRRGEIGDLPPLPEVPSDSVPRTRWLSYEEYSKVRELLNRRLRIWFDIAIWTGQHSSDVDTMTWGMVDLGGGPGSGPGMGAAFWMRRNTKNRATPVWLPMPDELREHLTAEWRGSDRRPGPEDCIAGTIDHSNRARSFRNACFIAKIAPFAPIDCRRTAATWWIERGGPKDGLKKWLGHSSASAMVDRHYMQVTPLMLTEGVAALNRVSTRAGGPLFVDVKELGPVEAPR